MKNKLKSYTFYMGFVVMSIGIALWNLFPDADGMMGKVTYALSGFGAGIIGVGVVFILRNRMIANNPEKAKQHEINEKDERNIHLREKAGYAAWHVTLFTLAVMAFVFLIMDNMIACLMSLGALLVHKVSMLVYTSFYNKKM